MMKMPLIQGISNVQTVNSQRSSEDVMIRNTIKNSWNKNASIGVVNGRGRASSAMKGVFGSTDFLSRVNYLGETIPNPSKTTHSIWHSRMGSVMARSDGTNIVGSNSNVKWVYDSSDFIRYKKQSAIARNYNDVSTGGDESNASQSALAY
jgi:hypothetical protein